MKLAAEITFAARTSQLDRAAHMRDLSDDLLKHRRAALLPMWQGRLLIDLTGDGPSLGWVPPLREYLNAATEEPVFLGMSGETPCFTADFSHLQQERVDAYFCDGAKFIDLRSVAVDLTPASATIAATAKGMVGWHGTHRFCANCGTPTGIDQGGWRRACPNCEALHFPRTDPVVIMIVIRDDQVLVGRKSSWPSGLYSLLAGFMEPGETLEEAVRRETKEEAGIQVGRVRYLACQPWPFPSSLMLGCLAEGLSSTITVDHTELEDAQWVSRAKMEVILAGKHPRMGAPRKDAIASVLLNAWIDGTLGKG